MSIKVGLCGLVVFLLLQGTLASAPFKQSDFTPPNPLVVDAYKRELDQTIRLSQAREMREDFQVYTYPFTREYVRLKFQKEIHARLLDDTAIEGALEDLNAFKPWDRSFLFPVFVENFRGAKDPLHFNPEKLVIGLLPKGENADWLWIKPRLVSSPPTRQVPGRSVFVFALSLDDDQMEVFSEALRMTLIINDLGLRPVKLEITNWLSLKDLFDESDQQGERSRLDLPGKLGLMY